MSSKKNGQKKASEDLCLASTCASSSPNVRDLPFLYSPGGIMMFAATHLGNNIEQLMWNILCVSIFLPAALYTYTGDILT